MRISRKEFKATIAGTLIACASILASGRYFSSVHLPEKAREETPYFQRTYKRSIVFRDNEAYGMRAFVKYGDLEREMGARNISHEETAFILPDELINRNGSFEVYAVDSLGNKSEVKKLYIKDKQVTKEEQTAE